MTDPKSRPTYADPQTDPVLRYHLRLPPPKPEAYNPYTGEMRVLGVWMTRAEYRAKFPDFSQTPRLPDS